MRMAEAATWRDVAFCRHCFRHFSAGIHRGISRYFVWHGEAISRRPWHCIAACLVVSISLAVAFYAIEERELDGKRLFTPRTAQSFQDKEIYEELYGIPPSQTRVLVTANVDLSSERDCEKRGLLVDAERGRQNLLEMFDIHRTIQKLEAEFEGETVTLESLCEQSEPDGPCKITSVLAAWNYSVQALLFDPDPVSTIQGSSVDAASLLGVSSREAPVCPGQVEAIQTWIILKYKPERRDGASYDPRNREWNRALVGALLKERKSRRLKVHISNLDAVDMESEALLEKDQRLLWASYAMVLVYCHVALFKNSCSLCKSHLAVVGCFSVVMAIYSAYGFCQICGLKFNPVHRVLPFLLMGLGLDDTFVIMSAYAETDVTMAVSDRIRLTSLRAGSAILVTSVTDFAAFLSGTLTTLMALRDFSIYAAVGILFDFFYQITFFVAFLTLEARREERRYAERLSEEEWPLTGAVHITKGPERSQESSRHGWRNRVQTMDASEDDDAPLTLSQLRATPRFPDKRLVGCGTYTPTPSLASIVVGNWLPRLTLSSFGRRAFLLIEAVMVGLSIYGCTQVKMDFRYEDWFVPDDSHLHKALEIEREYFLGNQVPFHAITQETAPNAHFHAQKELLHFAEALRKDPHVAQHPPIHSWFEDFVLASSVTSKMHNATFQTPEIFMSSLHDFLEGEGRIYRQDVVFDVTGRKLRAAKVSAFTDGIGNGWNAVHTVDSIRATIQATAPALDPIAYSYGFLYYDGYRVIAWETTRNVMLAACAVFLVTLSVLADLLACFYVLLMVALTDVMLFGFMWYVGLTFNCVTCVCVVLAVGIAVDYSVHVAHSFLVISGNPAERAELALQRIGEAVLDGAFTTGLATAVLGFAEHYILHTFFQMFMAIVICGLWHGLVVLPIVLSLGGPAPYEVSD